MNGMSEVESPIVSPASSDVDERYRLLVDSITDYAIYMLDPDGIVSSWNTGAARVKGYIAAEIIGRHFSRFYAPEDQAANLPYLALQTAVQEGRYEDEGWRVRKDGTRFWAHAVIDPIRSRSGSLIGFAKITRDLTEHKLAAEELQQSQELFRRLVDSVSDYAIFMLDPQGHVTSWNSGAQRIKGYLPSEIIGKHFSRFYTEADRLDGVPQAGLETAAREGRFEKEGWRLRKDGTRFRASVVIDAIHADSGELIGFAKVTRDITERHRVQESLQRAQQTLFQAQKLESIGQLTGGIAHDFNNLLTAVGASLELLRKHITDHPRANILLENALRGVERGATLTQRMLAFARRQELELRPVDVAALVDGMKEMLERSIGPSISIVTRIPAGLPPVRTDANQLEAAILNLAVNARDAMPHGGTIIISGRFECLPEGNAVDAAPGDYVQLSLADTGEGMDEPTLRQAVEPFFTTKGVGKGTGLGLAMVHGVAEQSGGKLKLQSKPGAGTTVSLWLPISLTEQDCREEQTRAQLPLVSAANRPTILVVDDDDLVRVSTCAMLDDTGYVVIETDNAFRALEIIAGSTAVDLLLTDQAMPGLTGLQLAVATKELRPKLPIILATGFAELPKEAPGILRRLAKPYRIADVIEAIAAALDTTRK
ncbi:MAG TPA: PAS domain S-box protein [Rudaea sp.]|jgi:PAS domain S-box-containing protein